MYQKYSVAAAEGQSESLNKPIRELSAVGTMDGGTSTVHSQPNGNILTDDI